MKDRSGRKQKVVSKWVRLDSQEKKVKETKEKLRKELLDMLREDNAERSNLLPVISETIPDTFFEVTGISEDRFLASRYPGWNLIKTMDEDGATVYILQKKPEFMPVVLPVDDEVQVTKTIIEYTPEIDWETLSKEYPEVAERISKVVETRVIDDKALEAESENNPEIFSILRRHTITKTPANKLQQRKIEKKDD